MSTVPIPHPTWCSPERCTFETGRGFGVHRGSPHVIRTEEGARLSVSLWCSGTLPDGSQAPTFVEIVTRNPIDLTVPEGVQLRHALNTLIDAARVTT